MRKDIVNIVGEIIDSIDKTLTVSKIEGENLIQTKLFVCDLKWVKVNDLVLDDQDRQAIVIQVGENYIVVKKDNPFIWTSKIVTIVKDIYYFKGTPKATNQEWLLFTRSETQKTPFIWLVSPTEEDFKGKGHGLERESELRLFFLDSTNEKFTVQEHHDNVIKYLNDWVDGFVLAIDNNRRDFAIIDGFRSKELSRFGVETPQGFEKNIIDAHLSAVEIRLTLPIRKGAKCLC